MASTHTSSLPTSSLSTFFGTVPVAPRAHATQQVQAVPQSQAAPAAVTSRQLAAIGIVVAVLIALVAVFGVVGDQAGADDGTLSSAEPTLYIVQPGDSLWSIAEALRPGTDPRPVVDELKSVAGTANLQIGQRLLIPTYVAD